MHDSLNRKEELSGPVLYLKSPSLFHAILCLSQSLISGLPCPSAAREHPTYRFSGRLRLLCSCNDKVHVKTVNGESNPNPQNSLNSKTTSMHQAVRHGRVHVEKQDYLCRSCHLTVVESTFTVVLYLRTIVRYLYYT